MKANGKTIYSMVKARRLGLMDLSMKVNTRLERNKVLEHIVGTTARDTKETGTKTKSEDLAPICGSMAESIRANGLTIIWKASEFTHGLTEEGMKDNIEMTRNTVTVFTLGQIIGSMKECGSKESSMALASM